MGIIEQQRITAMKMNKTSKAIGGLLIRKKQSVSDFMLEMQRRQQALYQLEQQKMLSQPTINRPQPVVRTQPVRNVNSVNRY